LPAVQIIRKYILKVVALKETETCVRQQ